MIRINLLPHRAEKRRARRTQFYTLGAGAIILGGLVVVLVHGIIAGYISAQEGKNDFLKTEIAALDKEIDEIKRLKEQTEALLSRKQVIESLQANRAEAVHLFNELAKQVPEGVYIKSIKQTGQNITLTGYAQSNARVSALMRNLGDSPFLEQPVLVEIKAATANTRKVSEFNLNVAITRATTDDQPAGKRGGVAAPGSKPAARASSQPSAGAAKS